MKNVILALCLIPPFFSFFFYKQIDGKLSNLEKSNITLLSSVNSVNKKDSSTEVKLKKASEILKGAKVFSQKYPNTIFLCSQDPDLNGNTLLLKKDGSFTYIFEKLGLYNSESKIQIIKGQYSRLDSFFILKVNEGSPELGYEYPFSVRGYIQQVTEKGILESIVIGNTDYTMEKCGNSNISKFNDGQFPTFSAL